MLADSLGASSSRSGRPRGDFTRLSSAWKLLVVKGMANKDVAKLLGLTEQAVASYKFQTISRLKEMAPAAPASPSKVPGEG